MRSLYLVGTLALLTLKPTKSLHKYVVTKPFLLVFTHTQNLYMICHLYHSSIFKRTVPHVEFECTVNLARNSDQ